MYKNAKRTKRIDLSEFGTDGAGNTFFAEVKDLNAMTWEEQMEFTSLRSTNGENDYIQLADAMIKGMAQYVVAWNLIDIETEQPLNPQQEGAFNRIPAMVASQILKGFVGKGDTETQGE